jgi:hypothetical protein
LCIVRKFRRLVQNVLRRTRPVTTSYNGLLHHELIIFWEFQDNLTTIIHFSPGEMQEFGLSHVENWGSQWTTKLANNGFQLPKVVSAPNRDPKGALLPISQSVLQRQ